MQITLSRVVEAARQRKAALTAEAGGYILLLVVQRLLAQPRRIDADLIQLTAAGEIVIEASEVTQAGEMEVALRSLLATLVSLSHTAPPALRAAAERPPGAGLRGLESELMAALIPINHSASGRALARLFRETDKALRGAPSSPDAPSSAPLSRPLSPTPMDSRPPLSERTSRPEPTPVSQPVSRPASMQESAQEPAQESLEIDVEIDVEVDADDDEEPVIVASNMPSNGGMASSAVSSRPAPSRPVPSTSAPSSAVPSRPAPSRPVPSRPVPSRPVRTNPSSAAPSSSTTAAAAALAAPSDAPQLVVEELDDLDVQELDAESELDVELVPAAAAADVSVEASVPGASAPEARSDALAAHAHEVADDLDVLLASEPPPLPPAAPLGEPRLAFTPLSEEVVGAAEGAMPSPLPDASLVAVANIEPEPLPQRSDVRELLNAFLAHTRCEEEMTASLRRIVGLEPWRASRTVESAKLGPAEPPGGAP